MTTALAEIQLTNTLSSKKEKFVPRTPGTANVYVCGPTVYGYAHVGNTRAVLTGDLIVRVLRHAGYKTKYALNITDIDDKIIKVANEGGRSWQDVALEFTKVYQDEMKQIGVIPPDVMPKATEHVDAIIEMITGLIKKDMAYSADTPFGTDVYYRVNRFKEYGKLSKRKTEDLMTGTRIQAGESKQDVLDFALWKSAKPEEPSWQSPWGAGRPGWHIECSAMIRKHFSGGIDIHGGGNDLIFPHHENEIAQSEGLDACELSKYWVHNGMLTLGREKMSKSIGNIFTTKKFLETYGPETLRLMILQHHYRGPMDFSEESILRAEGLLQRLYLCKERALAAQAERPTQVPEELSNLTQKIVESLRDDFNSAKALGHILKAARTCFRQEQTGLWKLWGECLPTLEQMMGLLLKNPTDALCDIKKLRLNRMGVSEDFCAEIESLLEAREKVRAEKNFADSDRLRKELEARGIVVMDGPDGTSWSVAAKDS